MKKVSFILITVIVASIFNPSVAQFAFQLTEGTIVPLQNPESGKKVLLVPTRPPDLQPASEFENEVVISKVDNNAKILIDGKIVTTSLQGTGHYSFTTSPTQSTMMFSIGFPYTQLDISALKKNGSYLMFYGRKWFPKSDNNALVIVTPDSIYGVNVTNSSSASKEKAIIKRTKKN